MTIPFQGNGNALKASPRAVAAFALLLASTAAYLATGGMTPLKAEGCVLSDIRQCLSEADPGQCLGGCDVINDGTDIKCSYSGCTVA
jgi:hypothetical protein